VEDWVEAERLGNELVESASPEGKKDTAHRRR
jgi:hypothetical protein